MNKDYLATFTKKDLDDLQARALVLKDKIISACKKKQYKAMHIYSLELNSIIKKLKLIQKELRKKEKKERKEVKK